MSLISLIKERVQGKEALVYLNLAIMVITTFAMISPVWFKAFGLFFYVVMKGPQHGPFLENYERYYCESPYAVSYVEYHQGMKCGAIYFVIVFAVLASISSIVVFALVMSTDGLKYRKCVLSVIAFHFLFAMFPSIVIHGVLQFSIPHMHFAACWGFMLITTIFDIPNAVLVWKHTDQSVKADAFATIVMPIAKIYDIEANKMSAYEGISEYDVCACRGACKHTRR